MRAVAAGFVGDGSQVGDNLGVDGADDLFGEQEALFDGLVLLSSGSDKEAGVGSVESGFNTSDGVLELGLLLGCQARLVRHVLGHFVQVGGIAVIDAGGQLLGIVDSPASRRQSRALAPRATTTGRGVLVASGLGLVSALARVVLRNSRAGGEGEEKSGGDEFHFERKRKVGGKTNE